MEETLDVKHTFEQVADQHGICILHNHCDNGHFADRAFIQDVNKAQQTISFCSVGTHHQNSIAEQRIHDIMESTRTMLLHAVHHAAHLWPQAIKHATNVHNALQHNNKEDLPLSIYA